MVLPCTRTRTRLHLCESALVGVRAQWACIVWARAALRPGAPSSSSSAHAQLAPPIIAEEAELRGSVLLWGAHSPTCRAMKEWPMNCRGDHPPLPSPPQYQSPAHSAPQQHTHAALLIKAPATAAAVQPGGARRQQRLPPCSARAHDAGPLPPRPPLHQQPQRLQHPPNNILQAGQQPKPVPRVGHGAAAEAGQARAEQHREPGGGGARRAAGEGGLVDPGARSRDAARGGW